MNTFDEKKIQDRHYLHSGSTDPRRPLSEQLTQFIGKKGSIFAYYKNFESARIKELADLFPDLREKLLNIESRLEDPLPILQNYVCLKEFGSSWSMKSVAPALLGKKWDYSQLEIEDGLMAQNAFHQMCLLKEGKKKEKIKSDLIRYCRQDTMCLALVVKWMYRSIYS